MSKQPHLDPSAFFLPGGPIGIVLLHGFTGSPPEMRLVGDYLNARGLTVAGPLLPGHGTNVEQLGHSEWREWTGAAEVAFADLQRRCSTVFVAGLSMGALVGLYTAAYHPQVAGAIAYSPAIMMRSGQIKLTPILKYIMGPVQKAGANDLNDSRAGERVWSYDQYPPAGAYQLLRLQGEVRNLLPQIRCPLLVIYSPRDHTIHANAGPYTCKHAGSTDKELVALRCSGHVITVDSEWEQVAELTYQFTVKHTPEE